MRASPTRLHLSQFAPAEAQAAAIADDIAYTNHDLDDGLRAGLLRLDDLRDVPLAGPFVRRGAAGGAIDTQRVIYEVNRRMITAMIDDVVRESRVRLAALAEPSLAGIRAAAEPRGRPLAGAPRRGRGASRTSCSPTSTAIRASCAS